MENAATQNYLLRFRRVLEYIDAHLDEGLSVEQLAGVAAFSKYHFHRQFTELFGIGVSRYIQLTRLKRAAYRLAYRDELQVIDIALASGYEGPEAFARAFRKSIGQSPSGFRQQPQWGPWHEIYKSISDTRIRYMKPQHRPDQVSIRQCEDIRIAVLEHRGPPQLIGESIRRFIDWRKQNRLPPSISATFNILHDNPEEVAPEDFRLDLGAATQREVMPNASGVISRIIPGGRCAVLRHIGSEDTLGETVKYLYSQWLPRSGEELRDFPLYLQRVSFFPEVPEHKAVTDVFLPLK